jgi:hypothetical protein
MTCVQSQQVSIATSRFTAESDGWRGELSGVFRTDRRQQWRTASAQLITRAGGEGHELLDE